MTPPTRWPWSPRLSRRRGRPPTRSSSTTRARAATEAVALRGGRGQPRGLPLQGRVATDLNGVNERASRCGRKTCPTAMTGRCAQRLPRLRELRSALRDRSLPDFVGHVLRESRLLEAQFALPRGQLRAANLLMMVQRSGDFAEAGDDSLRPFVRWLSERSATDLPEAESATSEAADNVVRVLTMHQAKGLEFPIVILAEACLRLDRQEHLHRRPRAEPKSTSRSARRTGPLGDGGLQPGGRARAGLPRRRAAPPALRRDHPRAGLAHRADLSPAQQRRLPRVFRGRDPQLAGRGQRRLDSRGRLDDRPAAPTRSTRCR